MKLSSQSSSPVTSPARSRLGACSVAACVALGTLTAAPAMAGPSYAGLGFFSDGFSIADNGTVVGENSGNLFIWRPTAPDVLEFIGGNGASAGTGTGGQPSISRDATRIAGNFTNASTGLSEMAIYDVPTGVWTTLGNIGSSSGVEAGSSWGISRNGQHIAGLGWISGGTAHAVKWSQSTGVVDIGSTVPGNSSRANAISDDGSVIVGWQDGELGRQAAV